MTAANDNDLGWDVWEDDEVLPLPSEDEWSDGDGGVQIVGPYGPEQKAA